MTAVLDKLKNFCDALEASHGELALAALFKREPSLEQWDFVVAARWLTGSLTDYELIVRELKRFLSAEEFAEISRIVVLPTGLPAGLKFSGGIGTPSALGVMRDFTFNGEPIAEAFILASSAARTSHHRAGRNMTSAHRGIAKLRQSSKTPA
jgi:hypothetical protein